jgi:hypothetical protein
MEVVRGDDALPTLRDPSSLWEPLALGAVAVPAGVVGDLEVTALGTEIGVTAEDIGPAACDRRHDLSLLGRQPMALSNGLAVFAEDVRNLEPASTRGSLVLERPAAVHRGLPEDHRFLGPEVIDGELRSGEVLRAQVCIELSRADRSVPQKHLNGPNI